MPHNQPCKPIKYTKSDNGKIVVGRHIKQFSSHTGDTCQAFSDMIRFSLVSPLALKELRELIW